MFRSAVAAFHVTPGSSQSIALQVETHQGKQKEQEEKRRAEDDRRQREEDAKMEKKRAEENKKALDSLTCVPGFEAKDLD